MLSLVTGFLWKMNLSSVSIYTSKRGSDRGERLCSTYVLAREERKHLCGNGTLLFGAGLELVSMCCPLGGLDFHPCLEERLLEDALPVGGGSRSRVLGLLGLHLDVHVGIVRRKLICGGVLELDCC